MAGTGFEPVGVLGGRPFTGSSTRYAISATLATKICYGQPVALTTDGVIIPLTVTPVIASECIGIFAGGSYIDSDGQRQFAMKVPATPGVGAFGYVYDDPFTLFRAKILDGSGADTTLTQAAVGATTTMDVTTAELATSSGRCGYGVSSAGVATTADQCFRIMRLENDHISTSEMMLDYIDPVGSPPTFTHAIVMFNVGLHFYNNAGLGI